MLYSFCPAAGCPDGSTPLTGLTYTGQATGALWDGTSPLYGTTSQGGANNAGTAYQLTHNGAVWSESVIHTFSTAQNPGELTADAAGDLYGTAASGGTHSGGLLFKLTHGTWKETALHNFCADAGCADGETPMGRLLLDAAGNLFGVAFYGGANNGGVVFERSSGGSYNVIHTFCTPDCNSDGDSPDAGLIMDHAGNLFGTTQIGGSGSEGTVYKLRHGDWAETVLYNFCSLNKCKDGYQPDGSVRLDKNGNLYGTTSGGMFEAGTVFELSP